MGKVKLERKIGKKTFEMRESSTTRLLAQGAAKKLKKEYRHVRIVPVGSRFNVYCEGKITPPKPVEHVNRTINGICYTGVYRGNKTDCTKFAKILHDGQGRVKPAKTRVIPSPKGLENKFDVLIDGVRINPKK